MKAGSLPGSLRLRVFYSFLLRLWDGDGPCGLPLTPCAGSGHSYPKPPLPYQFLTAWEGAPMAEVRGGSRLGAAGAQSGISESSPLGSLWIPLSLWAAAPVDFPFLED